MDTVKFFISLVPSLNFLVLLFFIVALLQLSGVLHSYAKCKLPPSVTHNELEGPCSILAMGTEDSCNDWTCLTWGITVLAMSTVWFIFQLFFVSEHITRDIGGSGRRWGLWLLPVWVIIAVSLIIGVLLTTFQTDANEKGYNDEGGPTPNTSLAASAWAAALVFPIVAGVSYWRGVTAAFQ